MSIVRFKDKFSLEKSFFEHAIKKQLIYSIEYDAKFIDIGIPQDYKVAQTFFKNIKQLT